MIQIGDQVAALCEQLNIDPRDCMRITIEPTQVQARIRVHHPGSTESATTDLTFITLALGPHPTYPT